MFDTLIREIGARFGLGDKSRELVQMLLAYLTNPSTGGISGFLDRFRSAGMGDMVQSWLGSASTPQTPSNNQVESALGSDGGMLSSLVSRLGLPRDTVVSAVGALVPMLISRLTPGGTVPSVLPAEVTSLIGDGKSFLGSAVAGTAAAATAGAAAVSSAASHTAAAASTASSGIGKWLPWIIGALIVILGLGYCSKKSPEPAAPPPANVPAPEAPAASTPAPAPTQTAAPAPVAAAGDTFTAPEGAGVLDGMAQDTPLLRVFFDSGKTDVSPEFADKAKALVAYLQSNADVKAVVSGFNDPTGDPAKNAELSKQRAMAVQSALVAAGVPADRTVLEKPADASDTGTTNAASRRVDVMLRK